jgi:DNA replication and repair protein RecF
MTLLDLNIHHFRNISSVHIDLHRRCNLFTGVNGSGKTTVLEAIYLLSSGHSFRTREISPLVSHDEQSLTVFAHTATNDSISIQKSLLGPTLVKRNRQPCHRSSDLARFLPCQVFYQDIFQIIDAGPATRRALLDWGLFHVEPSYHSIWKNYRAVLKQRNALLRRKEKQQYVVPWDKQLVSLAIDLDRLRSEYFNQWKIVFQKFLSQLTDVPCTIHYYKGWDKKHTNKSLSTILSEQFEADVHRQYTSSGPHQADIFFDLSSKKAKLLLSRGQQKIVLIALKLAQASLVKTQCLYLFDDLSAELDTHHLSRLVACLSEVQGQLFLTAMDDTTIQMLDDALELTLHPLFRH